MTEGPVNQKVRPSPSTGKSFIHDHQLSMNPCTNPTIFYNHGQYVAHDVGPRPQPKLAMQFSYCSTPLYHDIQPPTFLSWTDDILPRENDPPWENKTDERLLWRGSNTGINYNDGTRWTYAQRTQLVRRMNEMNGTEKVLFSPGDVPNEYRDTMAVGEGVDMPTALLNPAMMDIAFTGYPLGCDPAYCNYLETLFEWRNQVDSNSKVVGNHKYFVDVRLSRVRSSAAHGSRPFHRLMEMAGRAGSSASSLPILWSLKLPHTPNGSCPSILFDISFLITGNRWIDRIQPWVHYVPVQVDYSDLYDAYIFFRGGLYGEGNHDELARKIATAGREWSRSFWRQEDMTAYFFR